MGRPIRFPQSLRRRVQTGTAAVATLVLLTIAAPADARVVAPNGYTASGHQILVEGAEHYTLTHKGPAQAVRVARIGPDAPVELRSVLASDALGGRERTSSICRRKGCLLAVNGDFWAPSSGLPIGSVVSAGELLKSKSIPHHQLLLSRGRIATAEKIPWTGTLVSTDLKSVPIKGVNDAAGPDDAILYTAPFGPRTPASPNTVDMTLAVVRPNGPVRLGATTVVKMESVRRGGASPLSSGQIVLSARGKSISALKNLWHRVVTRSVSRHAMLRLETTQPVENSIGGSPMLLRGGKPAWDNAPTSFVQGRHPRTMVGRTATGGTILVTVDGRQSGYSEGMSIPEAARFMAELGAVDAINLDGGGSTTFVAKGNVLNRPSDRAVQTGRSLTISQTEVPVADLVGHVERPVALALVVVPRGEVARKEASVDVLDAVQMPTLAIDASNARDPASDPSGALPALVYVPQADNASPLQPFAVVAVSLGLLAASLQHRRRLHLWWTRKRVRASA